MNKRYMDIMQKEYAKIQKEIIKLDDILFSNHIAVLLDTREKASKIIDDKSMKPEEVIFLLEKYSEEEKILQKNIKLQKEEKTKEQLIELVLELEDIRRIIYSY